MQGPIFKRSKYLLLLLTFFSFVLSGCETDETVNNKISESFEIGGPNGANPNITAPDGCFVDHFRQPEAEVTRKLDLLFVTDSSGSFNAERGVVADGIEAFVNALPVEVDYQVAVMMGHGSTSSYAGRLYQQASEPVVLKSTELSLADIRTHLRAKLTNVISDNGSDGGELGLYSIARSLDDDRFAEMQSHGFMREDAALAVVVLADENDICAIYPTGVTPVVDPQGIEDVAKARDCSRTVAASTYEGGKGLAPSYTEVVTPEFVIGKLSARKMGKPLVVGGVVYNNSSTMPVEGENELGYGYLEFIQAGNGVTVDLANGNYDEGLHEIGSLATVKMNLKTEFGLSQLNVDAASIKVYVDGSEVPFSYNAELNQVHLDSAGGALSYVDITYCPAVVAPPVGGVDPMCLDGAFVAKASVNVGISIDSADGSYASIISGLQSIGVNPTVYTDAQIASGQPITDGITVMILSRKVVTSTVDQAFVDGMRSYIGSGGSLFAEYDGAALVFNDFTNVYTAFDGHLNPSLSLFDGAVAGGGLLLPITDSTTFNTDPSHPIMSGVGSEVISGLRAGFAVSGYNSEWLSPIATFTSTDFTHLVPAGTYPAVMAGRCGGGRVAVFTMNHLHSISTSSGVANMTSNALNWLAGQ